jgi:acetyl-CoA carboxylase carboxyltransferase component
MRRGVLAVTGKAPIVEMSMATVMSASTRRMMVTGPPHVHTAGGTPPVRRAPRL